MTRGLIRNKAHWYGFEKRISDEFSNVFDDVLVIDLPVGGTTYETLRFSNPDRVIDYLLNRLPRDASIYFIGVSLGGLVGMQLMASSPQMFEKLIMINCSHPKLSKTHERIKFIPAFSILFQKFKNLGNCEREILNRTINNSNLVNSLVSKAEKIYTVQPWSITQLISQLLLAMRCKKIVEKAESTTILCSKNDRLVSYLCSQKLSSTLDCELFINDTAGHDLTTEDPDWVINVLKNKAFKELI